MFAHSRTAIAYASRNSFAIRRARPGSEACVDRSLRFRGSWAQSAASSTTDCTDDTDTDSEQRIAMMQSVKSVESVGKPVQGVAVAVGSGGAVGHPSGVEGFHCDSEGSMRGALATTS